MVARRCVREIDKVFSTFVPVKVVTSQRHLCFMIGMFVNQFRDRNGDRAARTSELRFGKKMP